MVLVSEIIKEYTSQGLILNQEQLMELSKLLEKFEKEKVGAKRRLNKIRK